MENDNIIKCFQNISSQLKFPNPRQKTWIFEVFSNFWNFAILRWRDQCYYYFGWWGVNTVRSHEIFTFRFCLKLIRHFNIRATIYWTYSLQSLGWPKHSIKSISGKSFGKNNWVEFGKIFGRSSCKEHKWNWKACGSLFCRSGSIRDSNRIDKFNFDNKT